MIFFLSGFAGLWLMAWISWVIWMPLVAILWARWWRRLGVLTTGEFIERRYGGRRAAVYRNVYALYACFVWGLTSLGYGTAWMAATISPVLGWSPAKVLLVFGAITIVYSLISGLLAVAYNDVLQFVLLMVGNTVFALFLLEKAGGLTVAWRHISEARGMHFLNPFPGGDALAPMTLIALCLQGMFFAGSPFAGEGWTAQRYMAARNEVHAILGQVLNGVLALVVRLIPFILLGIAAAALYPVATVKAPAALWGDVVKTYAPPGLFGLLLVSSLAGYMAAVSSIGNWAASYLMNDIYRRSLRPNAGNRELIFMSRVFSGVLLAIAFACGVLIDAKQLEKWVLFINSSLVVFSLPLAWLKWFWWRLNAVGDMVGILGGFPAGYIIWFGSDAVLPPVFQRFLLKQTGFNLHNLCPAFSDLEQFPFWMGFGVLFVLGWIFIVGSTLLSRAESMDVLKDFYVRVRPIGWWGPVRKILPNLEKEKAIGEMRRDLWACFAGIAFYFCLTVCLFSALGGRLLLSATMFGASAVTGTWFVRMALSTTRVPSIQESATPTGAD